MNRINFKNNQTPSINSTNLNKLQDNVEDAIQDIIEKNNPVGTIRLQTTSTNPSTLLGFGTWVRWGQGRVPVGVDENDSDLDFTLPEEYGGEKTHQLTADEMPSHSHNGAYSYDTNYKFYNAPVGSGGNINAVAVTSKGDSSQSAHGFQSTSTGGGKAHNNLQPYVTCYMFKRTK